ncbi:hypothetical protein GH714_002407 [Hevea brasiliensis]|uniref:DUF4220 domain-containing protein n=1 Tax=Hevea brasiliensis TaxID=3981 RepID=A0A6A6L1F5_HEVBR|nr:hypothetical protein GH714_002407 [Hevea brasiliensis]
MIPTLLLFLAGIIKYLERTTSLYFASKDKFKDSMLRKPDPGRNYVKHMEEDSSELPEKNQQNLNGKPRLLLCERDESRNFFNSIFAEDAFKVIGVELNFFYEVLYTKQSFVHSKWGMFFRFISSSSVVVALAIFHSRTRYIILPHGHFLQLDTGDCPREIQILSLGIESLQQLP